jgi:fucose permease
MPSPPPRSVASSTDHCLTANRHYDIGYAVVSLIFIGNAIGFIFAALFLDDLRHRLGRAKTLALSQVVMMAGYVPIVCTAPFPAITFSFLLIGFGISINLAISNLFCGSLRSATNALGAMHGSYGIGGTIGPLIATSTVARAGALWSRYYLLPLGLAVVNAVLGTWAYRHYERELGPNHPIVNPYGPAPSTTLSRISGMVQALPSRTILLGAIFIFAYQGAEVSISGWVISFLITNRGGDPSSIGYVTSGFWAGITIGRFVLTAPAHRMGERLFVYVVVVGAAAFELIVWLVPNVVGSAVAVAIVGLLLGPVYPCAASVFMRNMTRSEKLPGMGIISAFGSSGGALAPFTTGIMAQAVGTFVLHPISIALFGVMLVCWYTMPRHNRTRAE